MTARLVIHAGTHKTGSTYIQERLLRNRKKLREQGFIYEFPNDQATSFKLLASEICRGKWSAFETYLDQYKKSNHPIVISAEHFAVPLNDPDCLKRLRKIARRKGYELEVCIFIRTQLDYINSRYAYSLRRFYHSHNFEDFVKEALAGHLPGEGKRRGRIQKREHLFDFWSYFQPLLRAQAKGLKVTFLPFRQNNQDPFEQLLQVLGLSATDPWLACGNRYRNRSPGTRGVWLARLLSQKLEQHNIRQRSIEGSSKIILQEEAWRGWKDPSYWGFRRGEARRTHDHFRSNNDRFARNVWGQDWSQVFVHDHDLLQRRRSSYKPESLRQELIMHGIADHLLRRIVHRQQPRPWHSITDPADRLLSRLNPNLMQFSH